MDPCWPWMHWSSWLLTNCGRGWRPRFPANRVRYSHSNEAGETQSAQVHPMLRMTATIYLALAVLCSACVDGWSMTQPMHGQFPSEEWPYWHLLVFTLSVVLFGVAVGLIHARRRWWFVTAAHSPLVIAGHDRSSPQFTTDNCGIRNQPASCAVVDSDFDPLGSGAAIHW